MAFLASLLAYLGAAAGIVIAFMMSYAVLFATPPDRAPTASRELAATAKATPPPVSAITIGMKPPSHQVGRLKTRIADTGAASPPAVPTKRPAFDRSGALTANEWSRDGHPMPPDPRAYARQWAYQEDPDVGYRGLFDQQPAAPYRRVW